MTTCVVMPPVAIQYHDDARRHDSSQPVKQSELDPVPTWLLKDTRVHGAFTTPYGSPVFATDEEAWYGLEDDAVQNYLLITNRLYPS